MKYKIRNNELRFAKSGVTLCKKRGFHDVLLAISVAFFFLANNCCNALFVQIVFQYGAMRTIV